MIVKLIKKYAKSNVLGKFNKYYKLYKKLKGVVEIISLSFGIPKALEFVYSSFESFLI